MVQRYLGARSAREAGRALVASGVVVLLQFALFLFVGLALHAWFAAHPPAAPLKGDKVFATFMDVRLSAIPGVVGLLLGAILAVSMSTLSSSLSASASTLVNDWARPALGARLDERRALRLARVATLFFALLQGGVALTGAALEHSVVEVVLQIASFTSGIVLGLFLLARWLGKLPPSADPPRRDRVAALAGFLVGLAAMTAIWRLTPLAWPWYALAGATITLGTGAVAAKLAR
jgi:Na+/proline symporter